MNKIYIAFAFLMLSLASCDMDRFPEGQIVDDEALVTVDDYVESTTGLYSLMRNVSTGDFVVLSDIQLDDFHAVLGNGNRRMEFYNGMIMPSTSEVSSIYASYYAVISQANFLIQNATRRMVDDVTPFDEARMRYCMSVAQFVRAYCYNSLADKFCESYKNSSDVDAKDKGLSIQLSYSPSAIYSSYPGRSSLRETYKQIITDLNDALENMKAVEEYPAKVDLSKKQDVSSFYNLLKKDFYISSDAIKAFLARVNLNMGNDSEALKYADEVIESKKYSLTPASGFNKLWLEDEGSEIIWRVEANYTHPGLASGEAFRYNGLTCDYVATNECIFLFDENDIRWKVWFDGVTLKNSGGTAEMYTLNKYPGNKSLYASNSESNNTNMAKPLRLSELYLISSEAAYNMGNEDLANKRLADLQRARLLSPDTNLSGMALMNEIMDERHRELIGEGFRLADLKRWNIGFTRGSVFEGNDNVIIKEGMNLHYEAGDYRFVWPIPKHEIDSNPQVKQNYGY